jgi:chromosome segregation ATPase
MTLRIIALLFDMNLTSQNLTVSNGILFGLSLSFLILPKEELQRLLLFFIAPETYHYAYQEMLATQQLEENKVKSEMVNRRSEIDLHESINRADAAKNESINKIRQLLSMAGKTFVETKYSDIETRINSWNAKLDKKEIDLATYEMQMKRIFEELQETYQDINQRRLELLPKPEKPSKRSEMRSEEPRDLGPLPSEPSDY